MLHYAACSHGTPINFCWRLEQGRGPGLDLALQARPALRYELVGTRDCWAPLGPRSGIVMLPPVPGGAATVEASWMPLKAGMLQVGPHT